MSLPREESDIGRMKDEVQKEEDGWILSSMRNLGGCSKRFTLR